MVNALPFALPRCPAVSASESPKRLPVPRLTLVGPETAGELGLGVPCNSPDSKSVGVGHRVAHAKPWERRRSCRPGGTPGTPKTGDSGAACIGNAAVTAASDKKVDRLSSTGPFVPRPTEVTRVIPAPVALCAAVRSERVFATDAPSTGDANPYRPGDDRPHSPKTHTAEAARADWPPSTSCSAGTAGSAMRVSAHAASAGWSK